MMFVVALEANKKKDYQIDTLRAGLAAGSSAPVVLIRQLLRECNVKTMTIT